jgi:hypothetical protein
MVCGITHGEGDAAHFKRWNHTRFFPAQSIAAFA